MDDITFLTWDDLMMIHRQQLELFGGADGFTDRGVVESAFNRAQWLSKYGEPDLASLASEYLFGLATTQGFSDGNKRTALNAAILFLHLNGWRLTSNNEDLYKMSMAVANNQMSKESIADWIRKNSSEIE
jgi:death on curing protein